MGLLGRALSRIRADLSLTDPKAWDRSFWNLLGSQSTSGAKVDEHTALTYSAVYCAINLIAGTVSTLPLNLMVEKDGKKVVASNKKVHRVVHTRWNRYMTAEVGREVLMGHTLAWGNGYAEKVYNGYGEVVEVWPIPPDRVTPRMADGVLEYVVKVNNLDVILPWEKVLHITGFGFDGFLGYSVIGLARQGIGLAMAMEEFGSRYFGNGTHPGLVVSHPKVLSETGHKNLESSLISKYSGLGPAHRLMLLEEGMKVENIGIPPEDSQFLESRQFQIPEIARWFNLPPHKLKDLTKSSFNNIESEQISYVVDSIRPWLLRLEGHYRMQLLSEKDDLTGYYFNHIVEGLMRGDAKARAEFYKSMWGIGAMNINEIRAKEDLDPIVGGDRHFVPLNMAALDKFDEVKKANDSQSTAPTQQTNQ